MLPRRDEFTPNGHLLLALYEENSMRRLAQPRTASPLVYDEALEAELRATLRSLAQLPGNSAAEHLR